VLFSLPFSSQAQTWGPAPVAPVTDRLLVHATNVVSVTIDHRRARVSCHARVDVVSDGPVKVTLAGCERRCGRGWAWDRERKHGRRSCGHRPKIGPGTGTAPRGKLG
jgi:hypothetical protein